MREDRIRWNKKYGERDWPTEAADIIRDYHHLARPGLALDIAAGNGRNAFFLAQQGFGVVAADISEQGLLKISGAHENLYPLCVDLDVFEIPAGRFQLIANMFFLNRRLYPWIIRGLAAGGLLIFETYIDFPDNGRHRHSPDFRLDENELLRVFAPLHILYYAETEKKMDDGMARLASLVAQKKS